jgi:hypothetical protein
MVALHVQRVKKDINMFLDVFGFLKEKERRPLLMPLHKGDDVALARDIGDTYASGSLSRKSKGAVKASWLMSPTIVPSYGLGWMMPICITRGKWRSSEHSHMHALLHIAR